MAQELLRLQVNRRHPCDMISPGENHDRDLEATSFLHMTKGSFPGILAHPSAKSSPFFFT